MVIIAIPGPSVLFVVGRAMSVGRGPALASVAGNAVGVYGVAVMLAFGLGGVVEQSDVGFSVLKGVGAAYLVWLGIQAIRHRHRLADVVAAGGPVTSGRRAAWQGFVVGFANPKALLLFGAVLPEFVHRRAGNVPEQMLMLALIAFVIALVSDSLWVVLASTARSWFAQKPNRLERIGAAGGVAMISLGLSVAVTGRHD